MNGLVLLAPIPPPEAIRRKAAEVVSRPEYRLDEGFEVESQALWLTIISWVLKPFVWLFEALDGLPMPLRILVTVILSIVAVALMVHIIWSLVAAIRPSSAQGRQGPVAREQPLNPEELEAASQNAEAAGDHLQAVRLLFRATLRRIEQAEEKKLRVGITNRELLRRYHKSPLHDPLQVFVETIDRKWYGGELCEVTDYERCREGHVRIRTLIQAGADALRA